MQKSNSGSHGNTPANDESINTYSLVSPRYHKKYKVKQVQEPYCKLINFSEYKTIESHLFLFYYKLSITFNNGLH